MTTYDVESPPVSQYRKLPSSHISSTPISGTVVIRGENAATEGCLFLSLGSARPFACQFWRQGSHYVSALP